MRGTFLPVALALGLLAFSSAQAAEATPPTMAKFICRPGSNPSLMNCSFALKPDSCKQPIGGQTGDGAPCLKSVTCQTQKGGNSSTCVATYTVHRSR